ncbi:MAG: diguanylate cyclase [Parasphingorhabdus sp.]|uniref:sensor domain-containing diguanylate cyclase n=1 Tax=Parasphingorhabdus sp. TaxID=2709688 RepID=UPI0030025607
MAFIIFGFTPLLSNPVHAAVPLSDELCTYGTSKNISINDILKIKNKFDCSDRKYAFTGSRVWVKIPFRDQDIAKGTVEVQGDNNGLTSMAIHSVLDDGSVKSVSYSERAIVDSWRPKGHYGLPVPGSEVPGIRKKIKNIYIVIDNPKIISSISLIQLASKRIWDNLKLPLSAMFGLLCGMAIMPFIYNVFFYGALRHSFMLWHSLMIAGTVVYTFSSSGLIFIAFPDTNLTIKFLLNYWTLAIAVAASGFFLVRFVERGKIADWLQPIIFVSAMIPVFVTAIFLRFDEGYELYARDYYHASFLPYIAVIAYTMVHAVRRGSKAIWFQIAAWTPISLFALDRIARGLNLYVGFPELDYGLYFALVLETIILAFGVANRILQLRLRHENTMRKQVELTILAETDGLTAIGNRRAFEKAFQINLNDRSYGHLAILDIDYFKRVNDLYGHEVGDDVLRIVGKELAKSRHFSARIGGEEFALLLSNNSDDNRKGNPAAQLTAICENLIKAVHQQMPTIKQPVTFSVGVTAIPKRASLRAVMAIADKRLYSAKNNGRNQVVSFDLSDMRAKFGSDSAAA